MYDDYVLLYWTEDDAAEVSADYMKAHRFGRFETQAEAEEQGEAMLDAGNALYYEVWIQEVSPFGKSLVDMVASGGA